MAKVTICIEVSEAEAAELEAGRGAQDLAAFIAEAALVRARSLRPGPRGLASAERGLLSTVTGPAAVAFVTNTIRPMARTLHAAYAQTRLAADIWATENYGN